MYTKQMVILAKSYKPGGWCVAGREVIFNTQKNQFEFAGGWVRPISGNRENHGTLESHQCGLSNKEREVKVYDLVEIDFISPLPGIGQPENHIIANTPWRWLARINPGDINVFDDSPEQIWIDTVGLEYLSARYVAENGVNSSLMLIKPENFTIRLLHFVNDYDGRPKKELRASFDYNGVHHQHISITDPAIRYMLKNQFPELGQEPIDTTLKAGDNCFLCMSLSPPFTSNRRHYKLIATIFDLNGYMQERFG